MSTSEPPGTAEESVRPLVAKAASNRGIWLMGIALIGGGFFLFRALETRREALTAPAISAPAGTTGNAISAPPDLDIPSFPYDPGYDIPAPQYPATSTVPQSPGLVVATPRPPAVQRTVPGNAYTPLPPGLPDLNPPQPVFRRPPPGPPEAPTMEGASSGKERVEASSFANPATTVPKGTVIQAVLETALDSNRAGFARAVVSRDVMGFDGSKVLIPRGSRIIGEYKSDVALGQNRVLIQWQRLMRPDGIVINIDSPSADPLGRAGVKGKVDTHFFQRFSGAILQSALDIGTQLATREVAGDSIYIGLPGMTQGIAPTPEKIAPTIRVRQGKSVSVFVARDLDFTKAGQ